MSAENTEEKSEIDIASENARLGIDTVFSEQTHGYMLTFPWPTDDIINQFAKGKVNSFWETFFKNSGCQVSFNKLFREFH